VSRGGGGDSDAPLGWDNSRGVGGDSDAPFVGAILGVLVAILMLRLVVAILTVWLSRGTEW
jgi:hypothetical protein